MSAKYQTHPMERAFREWDRAERRAAARRPSVLAMVHIHQQCDFEPVATDWVEDPRARVVATGPCVLSTVILEGRRFKIALWEDDLPSPRESDAPGFDGIEGAAV